jgi:3-dehydroquinate synthase
MNSRSIVLTGFMGAGKTSVGRIVAQKLAREFVDMDALIEAREDKTVSDIFQTCGEAYFRSREAALCAELAGRTNLVIATGGGTLVNPHNQDVFGGAFVVCLDATIDDILSRLDGVQDRPLLAQGEPRERVKALLSARRTAYARIQNHVDTTAKSAEQVADQIISMFQVSEQMNANTPGIESQLTVATAEGTYPIFVQAGLLEQVGWVITSSASERSERFSTRCAVVTNPRVGALYAPRVIESLRGASFEPCLVEIPEGERYKTLDTVRAVYDQLIDARLDRRSMVFALGGGVVGDLAGFVAATFLRGVPFVQLPTTLLAMVDASIGGKVAVDHPRGKNLIGAFKQPYAIMADPDALATLPEAEWRAGMAEVVKHGMIGDVELFERLENTGWRPEIGDWLERAINVKTDIVSRDPFEQGERAKLNLGHTFGHALERLASYQMRHGDAVAIGLVCATRLAVRLGICDENLVPRLENLLWTLGLPTRVPGGMSAEAVLDAMTTDKKRVNGRLRLVLPRALGDVVIAGNSTQEDIMATIVETRSQDQ